MQRQLPGSAVRAMGLALVMGGVLGTATASAAGYQVYVTNERSGDVTVIDGGDFHVVATIPVGKRPRGIHPSPDGKSVYVALSGTPVEPPPQLDAQGNPILKKQQDDDDDNAKSDKSADGIGVLDIATGKMTGKIKVGSDPEEFALSSDGSRIYVSNEDIRTASVVNIAGARIEHIIPVGREPEGVTTSPDGRSFYVTCEAGGDIYVVDTTEFKTTAQFKVAPRPRSVAFQPGTHIGFITSESAGQMNVIDTSSPPHLIKAVKLPAGMRPMKVKVSADGSKVYFTTGRGGTVGILDGHSYELVGTIKVGARPWGLELSPDGRYLFTANGPSNDVSVVDVASGKEVTRVKAGGSPWGLAIVKTP